MDPWLTASIALLAAAIAWGQWQTARQKLVFDLFERRYAVFDSIRRIVVAAVRDGRTDLTEPLKDPISQAAFLFGPDITKKLTELFDAARRVEDSSESAFDDLRAIYMSSLPIFEKYMAMRQKLPWYIRLLHQWT